MGWRGGAVRKWSYTCSCNGSSRNLSLEVHTLAHSHFPCFIFNLWFLLNHGTLDVKIISPGFCLGELKLNLLYSPNAKGVSVVLFIVQIIGKLSRPSHSFEAFYCIFPADGLGFYSCSARNRSEIDEIGH